MRFRPLVESLELRANPSSIPYYNEYGQETDGPGGAVINPGNSDGMPPPGNTPPPAGTGPSGPVDPSHTWW